MTAPGEMGEGNTSDDCCTGRSAPMPPLVALCGVTKAFGALKANEDVSFAIEAGGIVGLLGENGAGKTTAMNVLAGLYRPDAGRVEVAGTPLVLGSPRHSLRAGVGMVHQQFKLVETLSGLENYRIAVDAAGRPLTRSAVSKLAVDLGFSVDLDALVWQMPLAARQQLEILRTLAIGARILVLDEPTSVLAPPEVEKLYDLVRRIAATGRAVVLISHKLSEVLGVASHVVVMRQGCVVENRPTAGLDPKTLGRLIVGERVVTPGRRPSRAPGEPALVVTDLDVAGERTAAAVRNVSFTVRRGELVALVGVSGNGQTELIDAIAGLRPVRAGTVRIASRGPGRGFGFVPSRHLGVALAPSLSIADNAILGHHNDPPFGAWLRNSAVATRAAAVCARFGVSAPAGAPVRWLSGGNLQRLVLGRELTGDPDLVLAEFPTRGLDVASAADIRAALVAAAERGAAVLIASDELGESLEIATRILVMEGGRIVADRAPDAIDLADLGQLMTGGDAGAHLSQGAA